MEVAVLDDRLAESDEFLAHAVRAAWHLNLQHLLIHLDGPEVVRHRVGERKRRRVSKLFQLGGDLRAPVVVPAENSVRPKSLDGFVAVRARDENHREVTYKNSRESGVFLHFRHLLVLQQRQLVRYAIDVINVQFVVKLPLTVVLEVVVEALNFRRLHHFLRLAPDVIIARYEDHLNFINLWKNIGEALKVLLVQKVVGETALVDKVAEEHDDVRANVRECLCKVSRYVFVVVVARNPAGLLVLAEELWIGHEEDASAGFCRIKKILKVFRSNF